MKKLYLLLVVSIFASLYSHAQVLYAGPDDTICPPASSTLTATFTPATTVSLYVDDQHSGVIPIGFPFTYFGNTYTQCVISSNNYITFNLSAANTYSPWSINTTIPSASNPTNSIMCPWQDLYPGMGGTITYVTLGSAPNRVFVVSFCSVAMFSCTNMQFTNQIKLYEGSNIIETHIASKPLCSSWNGGRAIHGIQNAPGNIAFVVPGRNYPSQWTTSNEGYRWTPNGPSSYTQGFIPYSPSVMGSTGTISWYQGSTLIGTGPTITVTPSVTTTYTASVPVPPGTCFSVGGQMTDQVTVFVASPVVTASPATSTICPGGNGIQLNAAGATSYSWSPATGLSSSSIANPIATPTVTTTYTVTGSNSSGCTGTATVTVTVSPPLPANAGPDVSFCAGSGGVQLNASGGTTYLWSPAAGLSNTGIANPQANPVATTTYVVTVGNGICSATDTVVVTVNPMTSANAGPNDTICPGGSTQLNATGGTSYAWSPASGLSATNIPNPTANPSVTTTYTVTVSNATGCSSTDQVTILVPQPISLSAAGFPATCNGSCNGQTIVIPSGGIQPYSYSWAPGGQTTPSVVNQCAGTYTVTVTDIAGCFDTAIVNVSQPTPLSLAATVVNANCSQPDGSATVAAAGGTAPYTYLWNDASAQTTSTALNLVPGNYCVTVTDANGCSDSICVTISNIPGVSASLGSTTDATCNAACDGTASIVASGGTGPYTYSWAPAGGNASSATGLCAGSYTVIVTDMNGCSDTVYLTINEPLPLVVTPQTPPTLCIGQCVTLTASATGGTPGYTYNWSPTGPNVCPIVTTSYDVTAIDANGCISNTASVTVTVNPPLNVTAAGTATICPGSSTELSASATGGNGNYTYTWLPVNSLQPGNLTGSPIAVSPTVTTTYSVIVSDNCSTPQDTDIVVVTVAPLPSVSFTSDTTVGCSPLCVNFSNTSPTAATASWDFGDGTYSSANPQVQECYLFPGSYNVTLTVTDTLGCTNSLTVPNYITVHETPVADFTFGPQPTTILYPEISFHDSSSGPVISWQWSFGDLTGSSSSLENPQFMYPDTGHYDVILTVTTAEGCSDVAHHIVEIRGDFAFYMPNAFTPNGDGLNDTFYPKGMGINFDTYELMIFDRWGNMLFQTRDWAKEWNGKIAGSDIVLEDIYIWKVTMEDKYGKKHHFVGHVTVIK